MGIVTKYLENELDALIKKKQNATFTEHATLGQEIKVVRKLIAKAEAMEEGAVEYLGEDVGVNKPSTESEDVQYFKGYHQGVQDGKRMR